MSQLLSSHLEEYAGLKFYVEHVSTMPQGNWFRVHMSNGVIHNLTVGSGESIENDKQDVIKTFKEYLDGVK